MLVPAEVWTVAKAEQGNAVLVRPLGLDVAVPIFIAPLEAQSILIGLGSVKMPRPLTHDLFITVLESLESSVNRVEITSLKEGTYYAKLILESSGLGDRRGCAAFRLPGPRRARKMSHLHRRGGRGRGGHLREDGGGEEPGAEAERRRQANRPRRPKARRLPSSEVAPIAPEAEMASLRKLLDAAIEEENYEEAARLRDKIREIESA